MKDQKSEMIDAELLQIESTINRLSDLNIYDLDNAYISKVCSKILAFAEQLNSVAYTNLSSLETEYESAFSSLSLLKHVANKSC